MTTAEPRPARATRRTALRWLIGSGLAVGAAGGTAHLYRSLRRYGSDEVEPIRVAAMPIRSFSRDDPSLVRFGALTFRSGLVLSSPSSGFGGLSGLWRSPDGASLVAISDHAQWLTATVRTEAGRLAALEDARLAPIIGHDGAPLRQGRGYDCEGLAIADGTAFVATERVHAIRRFAWGRDGVRAPGVPIPLPAAVHDLRENRGLEALAVAPAGHPLAGALLAIAEAAADPGEDTTPGWVITGPDRFAFRVRRSEQFNVTDALFLPDGDLLLLERSFSLLRGVACRIRRVPGDTLRANAVLDGSVLLQADERFQIDNMEGLAFHRDPVTREGVLTLVSDDNFMPIQRTLLLEFVLPD